MTNRNVKYQIIGALAIAGAFCVWWVSTDQTIHTNPGFKDNTHNILPDPQQAWRERLQAARNAQDPNQESYTETYNRIRQQAEYNSLEPYRRIQEEVSANEIDQFQDMLDDYIDDREDEIRFDPTIYNANQD